MLKLNSAAIIQAMNVLPTDAPMRIGRAWTSVSIPPCTKLTVIREAAVEDCIMAVTNAPVSNDVKRLVVSESRICLSRSPASCCRLSPMSLVPYISRPRQPKSFKNAKTTINSRNISER